MQTDENLKNIQAARKAAYQVFLLVEEEEQRKKKWLFWKNLLKSFIYSILLLACMLIIAKLTNN
jgi:hypothetical protein